MGRGEIDLYRSIMEQYYSQFVSSLRIGSNERVLEFGCGRGDMSVHICDTLSGGKGALFIYDKNSERIKEAALRLHEKKNIKALLNYSDLMKIEERSIDRTIIHFVIHEMGKEMSEGFMDDISLLMKMGALLDIKEPTGGREGVSALNLRTLVENSGFRVYNEEECQMPLGGRALLIRAKSD